MKINLNNSCAFISDLHIDNDKSNKISLVNQFVDQYSFEAFFILGDFFEFWIGDEQIQDFPQTIQLLKKISQKMHTFFIVGNRDFLLGDQFFKTTDFKKLPDITSLNINNQQFHLSHGDLFCTLDFQYQKMRQIFRDPNWQKEFLAKPWDERITLAKKARLISQNNKQQKNEMIMDVNPETINQTFTQYQCSIIHGHTHRKNIHHYPNCAYQRIVLGDWSEKKGNSFIITQDKAEFIEIN